MTKLLRSIGLVVLVGLALIPAGRAGAVKVRVDLTPENLAAHGFAVTTAERKDGTVRFTLTRDLARARSFPADSELHVARSATLRIQDEQRLLATCELAGEAGKGTVVYRFDLRPELVASSHLTIAEIDEFKDPDREKLPGGGRYFELPLGKLAKR